MSILAILGALAGLAIPMSFVIYSYTEGERIKKRGIAPGFKFTCGGRFSQETISFPFVHGLFTEDSFIISYLGRDLTLRYSDIEDVKTYQGITSRGIQIKALTIGSGGCILFPSHPDPIKKYLELKMKNERV